MKKILFGLLLTLGLGTSCFSAGRSSMIQSWSLRAQGPNHPFRHKPLNKKNSPQETPTNSPQKQKTDLFGTPVKSSSRSKIQIGGTPLPPVPSNSDFETKVRTARSTEPVGAGTTPQQETPTIATPPRTPSPQSPRLITTITPHKSRETLLAEAEAFINITEQEIAKIAATTPQRTPLSQPEPAPMSSETLTNVPVGNATPQPPASIAPDSEPATSKKEENSSGYALPVPETDPRLRETIREVIKKLEDVQEASIDAYIKDCKIADAKSTAENNYIKLDDLLAVLDRKAQQVSRLERWLWILGGKVPKEQQYLEWAQEIVQKLNLSKDIRQHKELPSILVKAYCMKPQNTAAPYDALRITGTEIFYATALAAGTYTTASLLRQPLYRGKLTGIVKNLGRVPLLQKAGKLASRCLQFFSFKNIASKQLVGQPTRSAIVPSRTTLLRVKSR